MDVTMTSAALQGCYPKKRHPYKAALYVNAPVETHLGSNCFKPTVSVVFYKRV